jgi:hypothetical protein
VGKRALVTVGFLVVILLAVGHHEANPAEWGWSVKSQLNLDEPPLDVAESVDGRWLFILTEKEILVYSIRDDRVENRIPVEKGYDRLVLSPRNQALILTSRSESAVKIVQFQQIHAFDYSGLPLIGSELAPVTLVVFSDYQ